MTCESCGGEADGDNTAEDMPRGYWLCAACAGKTKAVPT